MSAPPARTYSFPIHPSQSVMTISSNGNIGIGAIGPSISSDALYHLSDYSEWQKIIKAADSNESVKIALERLKTTYYLSNENGSKT